MKSPTIIFEEFLSPLKCKDSSKLEYVSHKLSSIIPIIEQHYNVKIIETVEPILSTSIIPTCDNSYVKNGKWFRKNRYDFTGYIPLMDYNKSVPFDEDSEVYGGELIFKNYGIKISPTMGDLIVFPSYPNFIHYHTMPKIGYFEYIKIFLIAEEFKFDYSKYSRKFSEIIS
jgi:hypothetical protein